MSNEACAERARLLRPAIAAIAEVCRLKALHDLAILEHADNAGVLAISLAEARVTRRAAERAMQEHIAQHGCKI